MGVKDTPGRRTNLSLWNHPGDDIYGMIARSRRMVDAMEQLLGDEVYHYHSKMSQGAEGRRRVGMAPGLRLLVQQRLPLSRHGELPDRRRSRHARRTAACRCSAARTCWAASSTAGSASRPAPIPSASNVALERLELVYCEMPARRRALLPRQPAASLRPEHSATIRAGRLLCCYNTKRQRSVQRVASPALHAARQKCPTARSRQVGAKQECGWGKRF